MKIKVVNTGLFVLVLAAFLACKKSNDPNNPNNPNNYQTVNVYLYAGTPQFFPLNVVGGWTYVAGGVKGIIVYRKSASEFVALERNCTYDGNNGSAYSVKVQPDNQTCKDSICGSKFMLIDGSLVNGPAQYNLRQYYTTWDGNELRIFN